jgi:glycosyltransferase involved in cell wall biosynthesis
MIQPNLEPLVSVVLIVRNGEQFLKAAIDSVLNQTYINWEIILVDGQSTDKTAAIAQSYPQVRYILQPDLGISNAYNLGIANAQGEFIAFLAHDDLWASEKLELQVKYFLDHQEVEYVSNYTKFVLEPGHSMPSGFRPQLLEGSHPTYIMETLMAKASLFQKVGGLDPNIEVACDVDWFARAKDMQVTSAMLPQTLLHKRVHSTNLSLTARVNDQNLLTLLRHSIARKRDATIEV